MVNDKIRDPYIILSDFEDMSLSSIKSPLSTCLLVVHIIQVTITHDSSFISSFPVPLHPTPTYAVRGPPRVREVPF